MENGVTFPEGKTAYGPENNRNNTDGAAAPTRKGSPAKGCPAKKNPDLGIDMLWRILGMEGMSRGCGAHLSSAVPPELAPHMGVSGR